MYFISVFISSLRYGTVYVEFFHNLAVRHGQSLLQCPFYSAHVPMHPPALGV